MEKNLWLNTFLPNQAVTYNLISYFFVLNATDLPALNFDARPKR